MIKRVEWKCQGEEKIKCLVDSVKDETSIIQVYGPSIVKVRNMLNNMPSKSVSRADDDYWERISPARMIAIMAMAEGVKKTIPEENYKDIVLHIADGNYEKRNGRITCGEQEIKQNKSINTIYLNSIESLAFGDISDFCIALKVFTHELYHTKQYLVSKSRELTISNLIYCLEHIVYSDRDDYHANYDYIFFETEADFFRAKHSAEFIKYFINKDFDNDKYLDALMKHKPNWKNLLFNSETQCNHVKKLLNEIADKKILITEDILNIYPILRTVYDNNGVLYEKSKYTSFLAKYSNNSQTDESERKFFNLLIDVFEDVPTKKNR